MTVERLFGLPPPVWEQAGHAASALAKRLGRHVKGQKVICPCRAPVCPEQQGTTNILDRLGLPVSETVASDPGAIASASIVVPIHEMVTTGEVIFWGHETKLRARMAFWPHWKVVTKGEGRRRADHVHNGAMPLGELMPPVSLYPLFRDTFEPLGLAVAHPEAAWIDEDDATSLVPATEVTITADQPVYLRPRQQERSKSVWLTAAMRVDRGGVGDDEAEPTLTCQVDPSGIHLKHNSFRRLTAEDGVHVRIGDEWISVGRVCALRIGAESLALSIARIVAYDRGAVTVTIELNKDVEQFTPSDN